MMLLLLIIVVFILWVGFCQLMDEREAEALSRKSRKRAAQARKREKKAQTVVPPVKYKWKKEELKDG